MVFRNAIIVHLIIGFIESQHAPPTIFKMISQILKNQNKVKKITEAAFKAIDSDGSGSLEKAEL